MKLSHLAIGIVILSMVFLGMGSLISDLNTNYINISTNTTVNTSFATTYNKLSEIEDETSGLAAKIQNGTIDDASAFETLSIAGYTALKISFSSIGYVSSVFSNMALYLGLPSWAFAGFITILVILIGYAILAYIFRWRG